MAKEHYKELLGRLPLSKKLLLRVSKYMPSIIRRQIQMRYVLFLVSGALEFATRETIDEMGVEAFQKMLDQLPTKIKDKEGIWILPPGTSQEEVAQFLMRLKEREEEK